MQNEGWAVLCALGNKAQDVNQNDHISQVEAKSHRNWSIYISYLPAYTLILVYSHIKHTSSILNYLNMM
jgi:hypothetical protein